MVWSWSEHKKAAEMLNQKPAERMIILFDEVEAHLHPQWQRSILPALLKVVAILEPELKIQMIASTHAPLVLASLETEFCEDTDRILTFELNMRRASVREIFRAKQGDIVNWLVSDVFGLKQARSKEAEKAIDAAEAFMRGETQSLPANLNTKEAIHQELQRVSNQNDL
jgi:ABC-type glutathione transport system ATPase component